MKSPNNTNPSCHLNHVRWATSGCVNSPETRQGNIFRISDALDRSLNMQLAFSGYSMPSVRAFMFAICQVQVISRSLARQIDASNAIA